MSSAVLAPSTKPPQCPSARTPKSSTLSRAQTPSSASPLLPPSSSPSSVSLPSSCSLSMASVPILVVLVIGQSPRPDLTAELACLSASVEILVVGALDDCTPQEIDELERRALDQATPSCPLVTRLRDGRSVQVCETGLVPFLQRRLNAICSDDAIAARVCAAIVLCAGGFVGLVPAFFPTIPRSKRRGKARFNGRRRGRSKRTYQKTTTRRRRKTAKLYKQGKRDAEPSLSPPLLIPFQLTQQALREHAYTHIVTVVPTDAQHSHSRQRFKQTGITVLSSVTVPERVSNANTQESREQTLEMIVFELARLIACGLIGDDRRKDNRGHDDPDLARRDNMSDADAGHTCGCDGNDARHFPRCDVPFHLRNVAVVLDYVGHPPSLLAFLREQLVDQCEVMDVGVVSMSSLRALLASPSGVTPPTLNAQKSGNVQTQIHSGACDSMLDVGDTATRALAAREAQDLIQCPDGWLPATC